MLALAIWRLPQFPQQWIEPIILIQFFLVTLMLISGSDFFRSGFKALINLQPSLDSLVMLGSGATYGYSLLSGINLITQSGIPEFVNFYFEIAGISLFLSTLGRYLESINGAKNLEALSDFMKYLPAGGIVLRGGQWKELPVADIQPGDQLRVKPDSTIPVDGVILKGESPVDEAAISGKSRHIRKCPGDFVAAATTNKGGMLVIKALQVGSDTRFAKIIKMAEKLTVRKAPLRELTDKIAAVVTPLVLSLAVISAGFWYMQGILGRNGGAYTLVFALDIFISVLIIACPCTAGLALPLAVRAGMRVGNGLDLHIRSGEVLWRLSKMNTIVFDKTGTLTCGKPLVTDVFPGRDEALFLEILHTFAVRSEHHITSALLEFTLKKGVPELPLTGFRNEPGFGVSGTIEGCSVLAGSLKYLEKENTALTDETVTLDTQLKQQGKMVVHVSRDRRWQGLVALSDDIRKEADPVIFELLRNQIELWIITGDSQKSADLTGQLLGIRNILAEAPPGKKADKIRELKSCGKIVGMIGDGINDAQALALADVGISLRSATDLARETADLVLLQPDLKGILNAILLSRRTVRKIKQNLFWAFFYNLGGIPVAAGLLYPVTGQLLNPLIAGLAIALSLVSLAGNTSLLKRDKKLSRLPG